MSTLTIDTYAFDRTVKEAGIPEPQARAIAERMQKIDLGHVATQDDVRQVRLELRGDIQQAKGEVFKWAVTLLAGQITAFVAVVVWLR